MIRFHHQIKVIFAFFLVASLAFPAVGFAAKKNFSELRKEELLQVSEELQPHFRRVYGLFKLGAEKRGPIEIPHQDMIKDIEAVQEMKRYPVLEAAMTIFNRVRFEMTFIEAGDQDSVLMDSSLSALAEMASVKDETLMKAINETIRSLSGMRFETGYEDGQRRINIERLQDLQLAISVKKEYEPLPALEDLISQVKFDRGEVEKRLGEFSEILKKRIIGQDEVIEALEDMEWERHFIHQKEPLPDIIYLMGAPGTGKDTSAEAFTDALHGVEGAYRKHMFSLPILRERPDLWTVLGSSTGYIGSENFPPFLKFLVEHSGGKYLLEEVGKGTFKVVENPDWKGEDLPGFESAKAAVVFVNEFHNWSKEIKDQFIKRAIEKGTFVINNPNGGLTEIHVPVRFVIASNEGISLTTSREANGERHGKPLTYEQSLKKWETVHDDKALLKAMLMSTNGPANAGARSSSGISEELLSRIPERNLLLMKPLSPDALGPIAEAELKRMASDLEQASSLHAGIKLSWTKEVIDLVKNYDFNAEDNARPVKGRVKTMVLEPLIHFFKNHQFDTDKGTEILLSVRENADGTKSLAITVGDETYYELMKNTLKDKEVDALSDEEIDRVTELKDVIKRQVFGMDDIAERLMTRVLSLANNKASQDLSPRSAETLVLMGLSSTGKTELSKVVTKALTGDEGEALVIDFSQVQSLHDFKVRILGLRDGYGNPIASDFMKAYDRSGGNLVVVFDELANVRDPDLLKSLYDFFREPILRTFSDGKERVMTRVKVIVTGNSGIELYKNVPREAPMEQQMAAWEQISRELHHDLELQRAILEKTFPEPLINRWGLENIFFVPPHTYKTLKQLTQLKLSLLLEKLKPSNGRRGWILGFDSLKTYNDLVERIVTRRFNLREQGASIDTYIAKTLHAFLESSLLLGKVPSGARVMIREQGDHFQLVAENGALTTDLKVMDREEEDPENEGLSGSLEVRSDSQVITAYHEVGHALAQKLLFKGQSTPSSVTIIPGVAKIAGQWIMYEGVARSLQDVKADITREWVIRRIAVLAAGETAERLVTLSEVHSAGKSNDMERATYLAEVAVLKLGLSEDWGTETLPPKTDIRAFINSFSEKKKERFEAEVKKLLLEGRQLAREILVKNFDEVVVPMSKELAEKGELKKAQMDKYLDLAKMVEADETSKPGWNFSLSQWFRKTFTSSSGKRSERRDGELKDASLRPASVADIEKILKERQQKQFDEVETPSNVLVFEAGDFTQATGCAALLN